MDTLLAIDGNSLINRAFYGTQSSFMKNAEGLYTGALFGFLNILQKYRAELQPQYIMVAFDRKEPTFRHQMYDAYKGTRRPMPEELQRQMPVLKELLDALCICRAELPGYEADDILGTAAALAGASGASEGLRTVILTGDRDALQLIRPETQVMLLTGKPGQPAGELYDVQRLIQEYGVRPEAMTDVKALMGDHSDNIPGVPGVGEKTALDLIARYGSLDGVYAHLDAIAKPALRQRLTANRDSAYLSLRLGTICRTVPLPLQAGIADFAVRPYDTQKLAALLDRLEFRSFRRKLCPDVPEAAPGAPGTPGAPDTPGTSGAPGISDAADVSDAPGAEEALSLFAYAEAVRAAHESGDPGEAGEGARRAAPMDPDAWAALHPQTVYIWPENGAYFLCADGDAAHVLHLPVGDPAAWRGAPADVLQNPAAEKVLFRAKPFWSCCLQAGYMPDGLVCDLSVASYLLDSTRRSDDMAQVLRFLLPPEACGGADNRYALLGRAREHAEAKLRQAGMWRLYTEVELPLVPVLAAMEQRGFRVDADILRAEGADMDSRIAALTREIYELAGRTFNLNSPRQLGSVLFEDLGLKGKKKTRTGYSTDSDVLESLADRHPIVPLIMEYRQNAKLKSTYIDGLLAVINPETQRVHSTFHQTVTATGRLSSAEPNLQNIPVRSEMGRQIRRAFVPCDGDHVLIDADYSQIELRVLAAMSGDANMIRAFREGEDIHAITAAQVHGVPVSMVTREMRAGAKAVNFGIVYGISEFGLGRDLGIPRAEAKRYMDNYFSQYPRVRTFMTELVERARQTGYAETLFGRRRLLPELQASKYATRQFGERVAMNMPIQGTAADIIKMAMIRIERALRDGGFRSRLILQVHDELLLDALKSEQEAVIPLLREAMEGACGALYGTSDAADAFPVPLRVDITASDTSWYCCK